MIQGEESLKIQLLYTNFRQNPTVGMAISLLRNAYPENQLKVAKFLLDKKKQFQYKTNNNEKKPLPTVFRI